MSLGDLILGDSGDVEMFELSRYRTQTQANLHDELPHPPTVFSQVERRDGHGRSKPTPNPSRLTWPVIFGSYLVGKPGVSGARNTAI